MGGDSRIRGGASVIGRILCRLGWHSWKPVMKPTLWAPGSFRGLVKAWCYGKAIQVACICRRCRKRVSV